MHLNLAATDVRQRPLRFLWHELRVGLPLCLGVAVFLSAVFGDSLLVNLVYSLCIGLTIQFLIEGGRYGMAAWLRQRHPQRDEAQSNWPGWWVMAPWVVVCASAGYWIGAVLGDAFTGHRHAPRIFTGNPRTVLVILFVTISVSAATTYFFYSRGRMAAMQGQAEAARRAAAENQLKLLESQLEPHMLFNTLANLRVLIGVDPPRAQAMLDHLIAFLRATLKASRTGSHSLADEFERIADYLALMQVRMGARLQVALTLPDMLRDLPVPALLLQPLVENAILHGLEPKIEGGRIEVTARRQGRQLLLWVRDTGVGLAPAARSGGTGFGTAQVRERLAALFGGRAALTLAAGAEGGVLAQISLPLAAPAAGDAK